MTFSKKYRPITVNDLVFHDPAHRQVIQHYASGAASKHLLLSGPPGSGKSEAARIILENRLGVGTDEARGQIFHAQGMKIETLNALQTMVGRYVLGFTSGGLLIDEVDFLDLKAQRALRKVMDEGLDGLLICTTNNPHKLEDAFLDRFRKVHLERPLVQDWLARAHVIMQQEGHNLTQQQVQTLLSGFTGSARDFLEWLENYSMQLNDLKAPLVAGSTQAGPNPTGMIPLNPQQISGLTTLGGNLSITQKKP